jgi:hypothetical protein
MKKSFAVLVAWMAGLSPLWLTVDEAKGLPIDRRMERQGARQSRQSGRQASRARWTGSYVLPPGATPFLSAGFRFFRAGGVYYYPYVYGGRVVYVHVAVENGHPVPPPPASKVEIVIRS